MTHARTQQGYQKWGGWLEFARAETFEPGLLHVQARTIMDTPFVCSASNTIIIHNVYIAQCEKMAWLRKFCQYSISLASPPFKPF